MFNKGTIMLMKGLKLKESDENGFAAIVIALVIIMVLSLMTVGFAQLMRSNQTEALDKQLSSQAYDAAETGINDAAEAYAEGYTQPKTTCAPLTPNNPNDPAVYLSQTTINSDTNTSIKCLLTNPTPQVIPVPTGDKQPTVIEVQGCSATSSPDPNPINQCGGNSAEAIGSIEMDWNDASGNAGLAPSSCSNLNPRQATSSTDTVWTHQNILRLEIVPVPSTGQSISRSFLTGSEYTAFLCPDGTITTKLASTQTVTALNSGLSSGDMLNSYCTSPGTGTAHTCTVNFNLNGLNGGNGYGTYFLILRAMYPTDILTHISLFDTTGTQLNIGDAELEVDSTGQAQNVLKRVQVMIPDTNNYYMPEADVHGEVCKQLGLLPTDSGTSTDSSPCDNGGTSLRTQLLSPTQQ